MTPIDFSLFKQKSKDLHQFNFQQQHKKETNPHNNRKHIPTILQEIS